MLRFVDDIPNPLRPDALDEGADAWEWDEAVPSIPFFPADLPTLEQDPFGWEPEELHDAISLAKRWLNTEPHPLQLAA